MATVTGKPHFEFDGLARGDYFLRVSAPGFVAETATLTLWASRTLELTLVRAVGRAAITGTVTHEGKPVSATVWVVGSGVWPARQHATGADGRFRIDVPEGVYELYARSGNLLSPAARGVEAKIASAAEVILTLSASGSIVGRVVDERGRAVPEAQLVAREAAVSAMDRRAQTDSQGRFELASLLPGRFVVRVTARDRVPLSREVDVAPSRATSLELLLRSGAALTGTVKDSLGRPVYDAHVSVSTFAPARAAISAGNLGVFPGPVPQFSKVALDAGLGTARTDAAGRFRLGGLESQRLLLRVDAAGYVPSRSTEIDLTERSIAEVAVVLRKGGAIAGRVMDGSFPVHGAVIEATDEGGTHSSLSDERGEFILTGVLGRVRLRVEADGYETAVRAAVLPEGGKLEDVDFTLSSGAFVEGVVRDAQTGSSVPTFSVRAGARTARGKKGAFRLGPLPAGVHALMVEAQGYEPETLEIDVPPPTVAGEVTLREVTVDLRSKPQAQ